MGIEMLTLVLLACILVAFVVGAQVGLALGGIAMGVGYLVWGKRCLTLFQPLLRAHFLTLSF